MPLRVVIVHYHLRPGGVTRVIENVVRALAPHDVETLVITGEPYEGDALTASPELGGFQGVRVQAGLRYTQPNERPAASAIAYDLQSMARNVFGTDPDLFHVHNHSLGKNNGFPDAVRRIVQNIPVLFQIHDFAEDGRPHNYQSMLPHLASPDALYPMGPQAHYALLNRRDQQILSEAGVPESRLHYLPNSVAVPVETPVPDGERAKVREALLGLGEECLTVYPTRGIRRKNLGEMLFWSAVAEKGSVFASSLSPANPREQPIHDDWVRFAEAHGLPARFGVGHQEGVRFPALLAAADWTLTTSVAEGFGLAYLEPFLADRVILGRDLEDITADFKQAGVSLEHLYRRLDVPVEWIGLDTLHATVAGKLETFYQDYACPLPADATERALQSMVQDAKVDFGRLDESFQKKAIEAAIADKGARIKPLPEPQIASAELCRANAALIRESYSLDAHGRLLHALYQHVAQSVKAPLQALDPAAVLRGFLQPERFNLLRA
ncbi:MAG: glycosyltransferase [Opitutales bacterium]